MLYEIEDCVLIHELQLLSDEAMRNHTRLEEDRYDERARRFALAQVAMCYAMLTYLMEAEEWGDAFMVKINDSLELQYSLYRKARASGDRDAIVYLARIRTIRTMLRHLDDPHRREMLRDLDVPQAVN